MCYSDLCCASSKKRLVTLFPCVNCNHGMQQQDLFRHTLLHPCLWVSRGQRALLLRHNTRMSNRPYLILLDATDANALLNLALPLNTNLWFAMMTTPCTSCYAYQVNHTCVPRIWWHGLFVFSNSFAYPLALAETSRMHRWWNF